MCCWSEHCSLFYHGLLYKKLVIKVYYFKVSLYRIQCHRYLYLVMFRGHSHLISSAANHMNVTSFELFLFTWDIWSSRKNIGSESWRLRFCSYWPIIYVSTSPVAQMLKRLSTVQETWVRSLGREDSLEKEMATHSSTLALKIPWTEESGAGYCPWGCKELNTTEPLLFLCV